MKYKIQEIEFDDGHKEFLPIVKLHWWSMWKRTDPWGVLKRKDIGYACDTLEEARTCMARFFKRYRADKVKSTRDINVEINLDII